MKIIVKKSLILLLALLFIVVGCSNGNDNGKEASSGNDGEVYPENGLSKTEKVTLHWGFFESGWGREWADYAIAKFTEKYPNVTIKMTSSPVIKDVIATKMAANNDDDMFDFMTPAFNGDMGVVAMKEGKFEELGDLWERVVPDSGGKKLKDVVIDDTMNFAQKVDGKYYQIPMGSYALGLFFDKNFFEQNNWNQNPRTWDEFVELLETIKAAGVTPITYPGVHPDYMLYAFKVKQFEFAQKMGTLDQFRTNYKQLINVYSAPEYQKVWEKMYELGKGGFFVEGAAALNHTQMQMQLLQHKAAIAITGDWVENEMMDATPEDFEWGFMAIPLGDSHDDTIWVESIIGAGAMLIWKNKPELIKAWAKEFNMFLMTKEIQANNGAYGISPIRKDLTEDPESLAKLQSAPRAVFEYVRKNNAVFGNTSRDVTIAHPDASKASKMILEMVVDVAAGKKDPLPVLREAQKLLDKAKSEQIE